MAHCLRYPAILLCVGVCQTACSASDSGTGGGTGGNGSGTGGSGANSSGGSIGVGGTIIGVGGIGAGGGAGDPDNPATCADAAANRTYVGCDFWPTVTYNPVYPSFDFAAVVANGGTAKADIKVVRGATSVATASVDPGALTVIKLPWVDALKGPYFDASTQGGRVKDSVRVDGGAYHLTSSVPVTVWQFNPLEYEMPVANCTVPAPTGGRCDSVSNDAALLLPSTAMTSSYRLFGRSGKQGGDTWGSTAGAYAIAATQDGTNVQVQLTGPLAAGTGITAAAAGDTVKYSMNAGDVVELIGTWGQFYGDPHGDLSGSVAIADKPIQIISLNPITLVPTDTVGNADHLEETLLPGEALGKQYFVAPPSAPRGKPPVGHVVRIFGNVDNTALTYPGGAPTGAPTTINAGQVVEIGPLDTAFEIDGTNAFGVGSFTLGGTLEDPVGTTWDTRGDPSFSIEVSPEQFRTRYTFLAPTNYLESYADILVPSGATVKLDGAALTATPSAIGTSGWSVVHELLGAGNNGAHRLESDKPVGLQVIGFGHATAYYYPGGLNLKLIAPPPVIK